jgi:O-antigen/teichoic acid export membrane protein
MQAAIGLSLSVRALLGSAHPVFLTPNVNRGGTPADRLAWANVFQRTFLLLTIALVPPLLLFSGLAVRVLYSPAFSPGAQFAVFFIVAEVITLISGTYQSLILAFDHMVYHVVQNVAAQLLMVTTSLLLIPKIGIAGAGIGALTAPTFLYVTTLAFLHWRHGLQLPAGVRRLGLFTVVALVAAGVVGSLWGSFGLVAIAAKGALFVLIVAAGSVFLTADERSRLMSFIALRRAARVAA